MHRAEGLLALVVWLPRSLRRRGCPGPRTPPKPYFAHTPTPGSEVTSPTPGIGGGRWPPGPRWASSRNPRPRTVPWCSPNPLMSSVKTPGSLSMRHHSPALLDMAPTTHRPAPPLALRSPQHKLPPAADLSKTRRGASTPRHPAYFPTASGRRHLPRDGAQKDALAAQETSKLLFSLSGSVAPSAGPEKGRERRREAHPGPLAPRSWGGAMEGAGLGMGRGSLRPEPGAVLALSGRGLFPVLRRTSVDAAGPEHRLLGTGGSLQVYCRAGNRVLCSPSDLGHSRSGRCALCSPGIPASEARQSLRRLCASVPAGEQDRFRIRTFRTWPSCSGGWSLGELRSTPPLTKLLENRSAKAPFQSFSPSSCGFGLEALFRIRIWEGAL